MQLAPVGVECILLEEITQAATPLMVSDQQATSNGMERKE
jgi:hypothetical protein